MTAITDWVTLIFSFCLIIRGFSRGFMKSLINPFSIIVTSILSIIYYQDTKNAIVSLLIGLIGPLILSFILKLFIKTHRTTVGTEIQPSLLSRVGGAMLTLAWGWVFIFFSLMLLVLMPLWGDVMKNVHRDVENSKSYIEIVKPVQENIFTTLKPVLPTPPGTASDSNTKTLAEDPRFQKVIQDPEIQKDIDAHDIVKLMSNPKMMALTQQIMNDPATMNKILAMYGNKTQAPAAKNP